MFLGLDLGTTNIKAVLTDAGGKVRAAGSAPVRLYPVADGGVEQDIEEIFAATLSAIAQVGSSADLSAVRAVGISAQGGALQMLDGEGKPIGRVVSWLDGRGAPYNEQITREMGGPELTRHSGHPRGTMALGQLLRLRRQSPSVVARPNRVGFVGDVIVARLTGRRAHDATSLSCAVLYNPALGRADPEMLARVGISENQLPDLLSARAPAGGLLKEIAARTALPAGVPVSPAVHDQYASALGAGATAPGDVMFGAGTAWVLLAVSDRLTGPAAGVGFACRHVIDGLFGQIVSMSNGGSAVTWALKLMGLEKIGGREIDRWLASAPPGCLGLRCWPLLVGGGGAGLPAGTAGRMLGLRLGHGQGHFLRAVVEGLTMELARYLRLLKADGFDARRLVMCGGAAGSGVTPQIIADVTGLPVCCAAESATSALGGAILARGLVEPEKSLTDLSAAMVPQFRQLAPGPDAALYRGLLEEYLRSLPPG